MRPYRKVLHLHFVGASSARPQTNAIGIAGARNAPLQKYVGSAFCRGRLWRSDIIIIARKKQAAPFGAAC